MQENIQTREGFTSKLRQRAFVCEMLLARVRLVSAASDVTVMAASLVTNYNR